MNLISKIKSIFTKKQEEPQTPTQSEENTLTVCKPIEKVEERQEQPQEPEQTTLKEAMHLKYPKYADNILRMFEAANLCEATWENLTKVRLQRLIDYMGERIAPNSVAQYATKLKAVLNLYSEEVELPRGFAKILTPKKCASTAVYLTGDELELLVAYKAKNDREEYVRDIFLISAFGGMRHSDAIRLNESNIVGDTIQYVSVKTKTHTIVPLKPIVKEYILSRPDVSMDDQTYNRIIRRICRKCGITDRVKVFRAGQEQEGEKWQFVSSHTARRTCGTLLYLRGVDILTISKILGHNDIKTTQNYIKADMRRESEELMGYFR